jgi:hypothetical protein
MSLKSKVDNTTRVYKIRVNMKALILSIVSLISLSSFGFSQETLNFNISYNANGQSYTFPNQYDVDDYVVGNMPGIDDYVELRYLGYDGQGGEYVVYISQYNGGGNYHLEFMFPYQHEGQTGLASLFYDGPSLDNLTRGLLQPDPDLGGLASDSFPQTLNFHDFMGNEAAYTSLQNMGILIQPPTQAATAGIVNTAKELNIGLSFQDGQWVAE